MSKHKPYLLLEFMRELPTIQKRLNELEPTEWNTELQQRATWYKTKKLKRTNTKRIVINIY